MAQNTLIYILCVVMFLNSGCIHLPSAETKTVAPETSGALTLNESPQYRIESLIYQPEKFPLDDFFARLKKGEFVEAFKAIHLFYRPSNTQNQALKELISAGYTPVYIRFTNKTEREMSFDESYFRLIAESERYAPLSVRSLPREFSRFSFQSTAANVYNVTVVVVATLILMVAIVGVATAGGGGGGNWGNLFSELDNGPGSRGHSGEILNDVTIETKIDYRDHLIKKTTLQPRETTQGLLFFKVSSADLTESWVEILP
ncbi:MAG: hypothetical protein K2P92_02475 [Bdellovibrionaceae bacterium]|nr:hypothetical protein [Pseudobdellovibrionaceae bacterium]